MRTICRCRECLGREQRAHLFLPLEAEAPVSQAPTRGLNHKLCAGGRSPSASGHSPSSCWALGPPLTLLLPCASLTICWLLTCFWEKSIKRSPFQVGLWSLLSVTGQCPLSVPATSMRFLRWLTWDTDGCSPLTWAPCTDRQLPVGVCQ